MVAGSFFIFAHWSSDIDRKSCSSTDKSVSSGVCSHVSSGGIRVGDGRYSCGSLDKIVSSEVCFRASGGINVGEINVEKVSSDNFESLWNIYIVKCCEDSSFCRGSFRLRGVSGFNGSNVSEDRSKGSNGVRVSSVSLLCGMGFDIGDTSRADEGSSQLEGSVAMVFEGSMMFISMMIEIGWA